MCFLAGKGQRTLLAHDITFYRNLGMFHGILAPATHSLPGILHHLHPQRKFCFSLAWEY